MLKEQRKSDPLRAKGMEINQTRRKRNSDVSSDEIEDQATVTHRKRKATDELNPDSDERTKSGRSRRTDDVALQAKPAENLTPPPNFCTVYDSEDARISENPLFASCDSTCFGCSDDINGARSSSIAGCTCPRWYHRQTRCKTRLSLTD